MNKHFMLDIETSGVDPKQDKVLQIAIVEMIFTKAGIWEIGREFNFFQHTDLQPETDFALRHMKNLYKHCNSIEATPVEEARQSILDFFKQCGANSPEVYICGWNAGIFDLPFLSEHEYLKPARYVNGKLVGDCHYRIYEISGVLNFVADLMGKTEVNPLIKKAQSVFPPPKGNRHDALYDCRRQVGILNGLLSMAREI